MKIRIALILLLLVFLVGFTTLVLYLNQDFKEEFNFKNVITSQDINYPEGYNKEIKANIGELILINNGIFTQAYSMKRLVGCLKLKEGASSPNSLQATVYFSSDAFSTSAPLNTYNNENIEIPVGSNKTYFINLRYYASGDVNQLSEDVQGVNIYLLEDNGNCNALKSEKPLKFIPVVL